MSKIRGGAGNEFPYRPQSTRRVVREGGYCTASLGPYVSETLPPIMQPLLEQVRARIPARNVPLDFWQIDSGPLILNGFMDLASVLMLCDLREEEVPKGYVMLSYLFDWEAQCQSDGWGAFGNTSLPVFERIYEFYREVGLADEAASLMAQMAAFQNDPEDLESMQEALDSTEHELSGDLNRIEYLTQYFCDHAAELLYEPANPSINSDAAR